MRKSHRGIVVALVVIVLVIVGALVIAMFGLRGETDKNTTEVATTTATSSKQQKKPSVVTSVIGHSVEGRDIKVIQFGTGGKQLLFVGAIHGGYEWNSAVLAYHLADWLKKHPKEVPTNLTISVIPVLNPDAVASVITIPFGPFQKSDVKATRAELAQARFNAHGVDLNRNFACQWQPSARWRGNKVSAGTKPFSEPEAKALRDYILENKPTAAVFFHSQAGIVYGSSCGDIGPLPETLDIMNAYAGASGLGAVAKFDAYPVRGAAEDWLATIGIPAITVEMRSHESVNWQDNLAGIKAVLEYYGN